MSSFNIYELIFGFNFNKHKIKCLVFTFLLIIFFPFNASYSNNLCDNLAALESDPNRTSKPILFEDLIPDQVIKNCTSAIQNSKNSENISRFYLQRARGYLKTGNITDAVSDLNKSYELGSLSQRTTLVETPVLAIEETVTLRVGLVTEAGQPVASNKLTTKYVVFELGVNVIGPSPFV